MAAAPSARGHAASGAHPPPPLQYYDLPAVSVRAALHPLMRAGIPGFKARPACLPSPAPAPMPGLPAQARAAGPAANSAAGRAPVLLSGCPAAALPCPADRQSLQHRLPAAPAGPPATGRPAPHCRLFLLGQVPPHRHRAQGAGRAAGLCGAAGGDGGLGAAHRGGGRRPRCLGARQPAGCPGRRAAAAPGHDPGQQRRRHLALRPPGAVLFAAGCAGLA